jgi:hypothetical protein
MLLNAFIGKAEAPSDADLSTELGPSKEIWDELLKRMATECNLVEKEWNSYSRKAGWSLRLKAKKRNIVYLSPCHGSFRVSFVLGDRAIEAARKSGLPKEVFKLIDSGQRYPEGTAVRFDVLREKDIVAVVLLASIKLQH